MIISSNTFTIQHKCCTERLSRMLIGCAVNFRNGDVVSVVRREPWFREDVFYLADGRMGYVACLVNKSLYKVRCAYGCG
jgi:hypothetical protein